jgi:hypothetical protein
MPDKSFRAKERLGRAAESCSQSTENLAAMMMTMMTAVMGDCGVRRNDGDGQYGQCNGSKKQCA